MIIDKLLSSGDSKLKLHNFIKSNHQYIYDYFVNRPVSELIKEKSRINLFLRSSRTITLKLNLEFKHNRDYVSILINVCDWLNANSLFKVYYDHLLRSDYNFSDRLKAISLYRCNFKNSADYVKIYDEFFRLLIAAAELGQSKKQLTVTVSKLYYHSVFNFGNMDDSFFGKHRNILCENCKKNSDYFDMDFIYTLFSIKSESNETLAVLILQEIIDFKSYSDTRLSSIALMEKESDYANELNKIDNISFDKIRSIACSINPQNNTRLYKSLQSGVAIINKIEQLTQYLVSYGKMHKAKLYEAFDKVVHLFNHKTINVIDGGCGQALATVLLIDYINEHQYDINIKRVVLIEPSELALGRGLLHVDTIASKVVDTIACNKDLDSVMGKDIYVGNQHINIHLFSNILDVESFKLNQKFLSKLSIRLHRNNYFICVSPKINDQRKARLDMVCDYFSENFDTTVLSERDSPIDKESYCGGTWTRYEKVFMVSKDSI